MGRGKTGNKKVVKLNPARNPRPYLNPECAECMLKNSVYFAELVCTGECSAKERTLVEIRDNQKSRLYDFYVDEFGAVRPYIYAKTITF